MTKVLMHTNIQTWYEWIQYTLNGNEKKCHNVFKMSSHVFRQLCNTLRTGMDMTVPKEFTWRSQWQWHWWYLVMPWVTE